MTKAFLIFTQGKGHNWRSTVTDVEVSGFSEYFLFTTKWMISDSIFYSVLDKIWTGSPNCTTVTVRNTSLRFFLCHLCFLWGYKVLSRNCLLQEFFLILVRFFFYFEWKDFEHRYTCFEIFVCPFSEHLNVIILIMIA